MPLALQSEPSCLQKFPYRLAFTKAGREPRESNKILQSLKHPLRYAAGLEEGEKWKPFASTARLLLRPSYPGIEPAMRRLIGKRGGKLLFDAVRLMPYVGSAAGLGLAGLGILSNIPEAALTAAVNQGATDPDQLKQVYWRGWQEAPGIAWKTFAPGWLGGDTSPVGDFHRDLAINAAVPKARYGLANFRHNHPIIANTIDAMRSTTPLTLAQTLGIRALASNERPDFERLTADAVSRHQGDILARPQEALHSPIAESWANILHKPQTMPEWLKKTLQAVGVARAPEDTPLPPAQPGQLLRPGMHTITTSIPELPTGELPIEIQDLKRPDGPRSIIRIKNRGR